jgi:dynein heavy chain, axonemal
MPRGNTSGAAAQSAIPQRPALLNIKAQFNPPEVVLGTLMQVFKTLTKLLQNVLHSANQFQRWMDGTCRLIPKQTEVAEAAGQEDLMANDFTFYKDVFQNPALIEMTINIQSNIQNVFQVRGVCIVLGTQLTYKATYRTCFR